MPSPDEIFSNWKGVIDNDLAETISRTFDLSLPNTYIYRAESFAMTMPQIQEQINSGDLHYKYQSHGKVLDVRFSISACREKAGQRRAVLTDFQGSSSRYYSIHLNLLPQYRHLQGPDVVPIQCKEIISPRSRCKVPSITTHRPHLQSVEIQNPYQSLL